MRLKLAIVLDDQPDYATSIARGIRIFGGSDTKYYPTIEALEREIENRGISLRKILESSSAIVCDNNFDPSFSSSFRNKRGISFLRNEVAPLVTEIAPEERPLLICFAPSTKLESHQINELWLEGIVFFEKIEEAALIGFMLGVTKHLGKQINRDELLVEILGFPPEAQARNNRDLERFCTSLWAQYLEDLEGIVFPGENEEMVEGKSLNLPWEKILNIVSENLSEINYVLTPEQLQQRIESKRPSGIEGGIIHKER